MSIIRSAYTGMIYEIRVHCRICRMLEWQNCLRVGGHPGQRESTGYYEITTIPPITVWCLFIRVQYRGGIFDLHDEKAAACSVRYDLERAKLTSNSSKGRGHF